MAPLAHRQKSKRSYARWTPAQVATLRALVYDLPLAELARRCGHSAEATRHKCSRLRVREAHLGDWYNAHDLAPCFRVHHATIGRWIDAGWLEAAKPGKDWRITPEAICAFILAHPLEVIRADVPWVLTMIAPALVPAWRQRMERALERAYA
jgi:hypothetical protein